MLNDVKSALASQRVSTALIIDDLYDTLPTIAHISSAAWSFFFDDLKARERELIASAFPGRDPDAHRTQLSSDPGFLSFVWQRRGDSPVFAKLFEDFESEMRKGRIVLDKLHAFLATTLELKTFTAGTHPLDAAEGQRSVRAVEASAEADGAVPILAAAAEAALAGAEVLGEPQDSGPQDAVTPEETADIVFMDLFLGAGQDDAAQKSSIARVRKLLARRKANPPLVVLMSSSTRLKEKVDDFRDDAELLGCQFRMLEKPEIHQEERLLDVVFRLVTRYRDTLRVAAFVETWRDVLTEVSNVLLRRIRRLDLRDYANLQALVLEAEGERIGNYLVELYDRVFHYELEGDSRLLTAGRELNEIDWTEFPPPHFLPAADAMEMLDNLMFHHPDSIAPDEPVTFGDVLFVSLSQEAGVSEVPKIDVSAGEVLALLVVTQVCDLQRGGVGRLLFLPGIARPMDLRLHKRPDKLCTPILRTGEQVFVVNWQPETAPFTCTEAELKTRLENGYYRRARRFRTIYALQLQQEFASSLTRVGTIVGPPVRHAVGLRVFFRSRDQNLTLLIELPDTPENAVAMVGRDSDGLVDLLALSPDAVERLRAALMTVDPQAVAALGTKGEPKKWSDAVTARGLYRALEHGIRYKRDRRLRPLKDADDIVEIVGPFTAEKETPTVGEKFGPNGPLIIHILPHSRPASANDLGAGGGEDGHNQSKDSPRSPSGSESPAS